MSPRATSTDLFLHLEASSLYPATQGSPGLLTEAHRERYRRQVWVTRSSLPPQLADAHLRTDLSSKRNQKEGHEFQVSHSQNASLKSPLGMTVWQPLKRQSAPCLHDYHRKLFAVPPWLFASLLSPLYSSAPFSTTL